MRAVDGSIYRAGLAGYAAVVRSVSEASGPAGAPASDVALALAHALGSALGVCAIDFAGNAGAGGIDALLTRIETVQRRALDETIKMVMAVASLSEGS